MSLVPCVPLLAQASFPDTSQGGTFPDTLFIRSEEWSVNCKVFKLTEKTVTVQFPSQKNLVEIHLTSLSRITSDDGRRITFDESGNIEDEITISKPVIIAEAPNLGSLVLADSQEVVLNGITINPPADSLELHYFNQGGEYVRAVLLDSAVQLQFDRRWRDDSGRLVAYVILPNGVIFNAELIKSGYSKVNPEGVVKYLDEFTALEAEAKRENRGIWETFRPPPPATEQRQRQVAEPAVEWDFKNLQPSFSFSHTYLDNWIKGGNDAFAFQVIFNIDFERQSPWTRLDNEVDFKYGQARIGGGAKAITPNLIDMRSGLQIGPRRLLNPFIGGSLKTQITTGFRFKNDGQTREPRFDFWDPVTLTYRFGVTINTVDELKIQFSGDIIEQLGNKYVEQAKIDDRKTEIVETRKTTKKMGAFIKYKRTFRSENDRMLYIDSKIDIKSAFKHYSLTTLDWRNVIELQLISFVKFRVDSQLIWNKVKLEKWQFWNSMGITFSYNVLDLFGGN